jgi:hypothetical protein
LAARTVHVAAPSMRRRPRVSLPHSPPEKIAAAVAEGEATLMILPSKRRYSSATLLVYRRIHWEPMHYCKRPIFLTRFA